jgi:hypothetical protein
MVMLKGRLYGGPLFIDHSFKESDLDLLFAWLCDKLLYSAVFY